MQTPSAGHGTVIELKALLHTVKCGGAFKESSDFTRRLVGGDDTFNLHHDGGSVGVGELKAHGGNLTVYVGVGNHLNGYIGAKI